MKFAVIKTGGKQYKVSEGSIVEIERIKAEDKKVTFAEILLYADGQDIQLGNPFIAGAFASGTVLEDFRGEKIRVAKFKAKARYRRSTGHRQALTRVKIESIGIGEVKKTAEKAEKSTKKVVKKAKA